MYILGFRITDTTSPTEYMGGRGEGCVGYILGFHILYTNLPCEYEGGQGRGVCGVNFGVPSHLHHQGRGVKSAQKKFV